MLGGMALAPLAASPVAAGSATMLGKAVSSQPIIQALTTGELNFGRLTRLLMERYTVTQQMHSIGKYSKAWGAAGKVPASTTELIANFREAYLGIALEAGEEDTPILSDFFTREAQLVYWCAKYQDQEVPENWLNDAIFTDPQGTWQVAKKLLRAAGFTEDTPFSVEAFSNLMEQRSLEGFAGSLRTAYTDDPAEFARQFAEAYKQTHPSKIPDLQPLLDGQLPSVLQDEAPRKPWKEQLAQAKEKLSFSNTSDTSDYQLFRLPEIEGSPQTYLVIPGAKGSLWGAKEHLHETLPFLEENPKVTWDHNLIRVPNRSQEDIALRQRAVALINEFVPMKQPLPDSKVHEQRILGSAGQCAETAKQMRAG